MASFAQLKADALAHYKANIDTLNAGSVQIESRLIVADRSEPVETPFIKIIVEPGRKFALAGRKPVKAEATVQIFCGVGGFAELSDAEDAAMELAGLALAVGLRFGQFRTFTAPQWDAHYQNYSVAYIEAEAYYDPVGEVV